MLNFFVFRSRSKTTHIASFIFSDSCFSAAKILKLSLLALTVASLDNNLFCMRAATVDICLYCLVWCITNQADRNWDTLKHFQNCIKMLSQFRTPYCINLRQYSKRSKRGGVQWQSTDTILTIFTSSFCTRKFCRHITLQPFVAIATCKKTCFPQIVLLQYKAKPYLGFTV